MNGWCDAIVLFLILALMVMLSICLWEGDPCDKACWRDNAPADCLERCRGRMKACLSEFEEPR